ncbi:MAG TPA: hypothetical protein VIR61_00670 [Sulfuricaulis sp.]
MSNPVEPSSETLASDPLRSGEFAYGLAVPVTGVFNPVEAAQAPPAAEIEVPETPIEPPPVAPAIPEGWASSPWMNLSFLSTPGHIPMPSPELAEATQPPPATAVSPPAPSSPDIRPTEVPATPVSPGVAETTAGEGHDVAAQAGMAPEVPAPSAIETPPAPVAAPPAPVSGEPNVQAGQVPTAAATPASAAGTPPPHPAPEAPAAVTAQVQMSQSMADKMAAVLHDVLHGKSAP